MKTIKVWDYLDEYDEIGDEIHAAVTAVFGSGRLILGEHVDRFERSFAAYCAQAHGVGVNSGTDALFIAMKALGCEAGDEVITVANTAVPTVSAIVSTGASPVFVDIARDTYLMDVTQIEARITPRTKGILPVHLYGQCVDMDAVMSIAERHGLWVLEDCAQSTGGRYKDRMAGSLGHAAAHSFYPTKNLGAYGDGGMITTNDDTVADAFRRLRFYGMSGRYYAEAHGYNSRLDEVQAAILAVKLNHLPSWLAKRAEIADQYVARLAETDLVLPTTAPGNSHSYYIYVVRHPSRDRLIDALRAQEIFVNISYPFPIHTMTGYAHLGYTADDLPETESAADEIFSLPMYPFLSRADQDRVCDVLIDALR